MEITNVESSDNYSLFVSNIWFGKRHTFNRAWQICHLRANFHFDDDFVSQASSQDRIVMIHDIINPKLVVALLHIKILQYVATAISAPLSCLYLLSCVTLNHTEFVGPAHDWLLWTCRLSFPPHDFGQWPFPVVIMICARLTLLSPIAGLLLRSKMQLVLYCNFLEANLLLVSSNIGVNPVISWSGPNSFEQKSRRKIPRFEGGALLLIFCLEKRPFKHFPEALVDQRLQCGIYGAIPHAKRTILEIYQEFVLRTFTFWKLFEFWPPKSVLLPTVRWVWCWCRIWRVFQPGRDGIKASWDSK